MICDLSTYARQVVGSNFQRIIRPHSDIKSKTLSSIQRASPEQSRQSGK
jgi:hypothetical protein